MPSPKVYSATDQAILESPPLKPLSGTRASAQGYVDRVTKSGWWRRNFPFMAPAKVWVWLEDDESVGAYVSAAFTTTHKGEIIPSMVVGREEIYNGVQAVSDRWVLLHELGHIMNGTQLDGTHGPSFIYTYHCLIKEFLGAERAHAFKRACKDNQIRLNYGLLLS